MTLAIHPTAVIDPKAQLDGLVKNLDMGQLTTRQLERIADGEDPIHVLATTTSQG